MHLYFMPNFYILKFQALFRLNEPNLFHCCHYRLSLAHLSLVSVAEFPRSKVHLNFKPFLFRSNFQALFRLKLCLLYSDPGS